MEENEIKKVLYKEKPTAKRTRSKSAPITRNVTHQVYECASSLGEHTFEIPISEFFSGSFEEEIPAQLLIRWIV